MFSRIRRYFLTGLGTILPIGLTVFVLWFIISNLGKIARPLLIYLHLFERLPPMVITIISFILLIVIITLIGTITSGFIGRRIVSSIDQFFQRLPLARSVYTSARQLTDAVFVKRSSLRRTVIVEYPRKGVYAVGFLTSETPLQLPDSRRAYPVFFPTAPNPTSGWLAIIPEEEITKTSLNIEEGLKFVVSGGLVPPEIPAFLTKDGPNREKGERDSPISV